MSVESTAPFPFRRIDQVCIVVRDLHQAMERYWTHAGIGPWRVYTYGESLVRERNYRGEPADYEFLVAFAQTPTVMLELIQPLRGPTIYDEFLARHGEGIHHFGMFVPNLAKAVAEARELGFEVIQSGVGTGPRGDGGFAYLSTETTFSALFELIEAPKERYTPQEIFPSP